MRGQLTKVQRLIQANTRLKNENKKLRERVVFLERKDKKSQEIIETLKLQIEELQKIVFGGPKKKDFLNKKTKSTPPPKQSRRLAKSYRRAIPRDEDITEVKHLKICHCIDCKTKLVKLRKKEQYIEDILPMSEWYKVLKTATKEIVTVGYCNHCKKQVSAKALNIQKVSLGNNIRQFIAFSTVISRLSYQQIKDFLHTTIRIDISDGEIANTLEKQAGLLSPVFERLKKRIRGEPSVHYDETSWKVQKELQGNYAWVMASVRTTDTVFRIGQSRGGGNINELRGDNTNQIGITDDYGAYKNAFKVHALCWAHPHRKLRDLANSDKLTDRTRRHCEKVYLKFKELYKEVNIISKRQFVKSERIKSKKRTLLKFEKICIPHKLDPQKLARIKKRLLEQKECYFVCLLYPNIPLDNNKAERSLRHLVLKRKNSYGSRTQKSADYMSILYSVLLSLWWKSKESFFKEWDRELRG